MDEFGEGGRGSARCKAQGREEAEGRADLVGDVAPTGGTRTGEEEGKEAFMRSGSTRAGRRREGMRTLWPVRERFRSPGIRRRAGAWRR